MSFSTNKIKLDDDTLNTIEIILNSTLTDIQIMFAYCQDIVWIDFSNFDFSQVNERYIRFNGYVFQVKIC